MATAGPRPALRSGWSVWKAAQATALLGALACCALLLSILVTAGPAAPFVHTCLLFALVTLVVVMAAGMVAIKTGPQGEAASPGGDRLGLAALDALQVAHLILNADGTAQWVNRRAAALFGDVPKPLNILRERLVGGEDRQILDAMIRDAALTRSGTTIVKALSPAGAAEPISVSALPMLMRPGSILWRVESLAEREPSGARPMGDFIDEMPLGLFAIDASGRFTSVNRRLAQWLESTPERLIGDRMEFEEFVIPGKGPAGQRPYTAQEEGDWAEITLRGRLGRLLRTAVIQRKGALGGAAFVGVVRELVTDRSVDETLRMVRQRFQHFFEAAPIGIALVDAHGQVTEANRALETLLTGQKTRLAGRTLSEFLSEEGKAALEERLKAPGIAGVGSPSLDLVLNGTGQREKTAAVFISRLDSENGGAAGAVLHFIDLTDHKHLEVQLAQSQKMQAIGQLAGGIAHDFNNLLTAMIGFCDLLLVRFKAGDQSFADVMQIKQNANRAANLVRQLLAFSRQQTLQPRILNIGDVLADLSHLLTRLLSQHVELRTVTARDVGPVKVDQGQLEQVIINLAVNARDAMPDGGQLRIETRRAVLDRPLRAGAETIPAGAWVLIEVSDQGTGIPPEILPRIFEPFFSTKPTGSGTGLGLSTVYGIVKQTGGHIIVQSTLRVGTKFQIYLPEFEAGQAHDEAAAIADLTPPQPADLNGAGTILLVEDEEPVRLFSARALRNRGYRVLEADGGAAALDLVASHQGSIDLVITDVMMPRMDGPTMVRQLRSRLPDIRVIFISGYAEDAFRQRLDSDSAIMFLPKPFSLKQLAEKVRDALTPPNCDRPSRTNYVVIGNKTRTYSPIAFIPGR